MTRTGRFIIAAVIALPAVACRRNGSLATLTFPAPVPGAPTTVLGVATETNEHFCEAARE